MNSYEITTIIIGIFQIIATGLISLVVYRQTEKQKKLEISNQILDQYNILNSAALSSDTNLLTFDTIGRDDDEDISLRRKRWAGFFWLSTLSMNFLAKQEGMFDDEYAKKALTEQLEIILKDDDIWFLLCNRGFHPSFIDYCKPIRDKVKSKRT